LRNGGAKNQKRVPGEAVFSCRGSARFVPGDGLDDPPQVSYGYFFIKMIVSSVTFYGESFCASRIEIRAQTKKLTLENHENRPVFFRGGSWGL
jgi:hypothetical protein